MERSTPGPARVDLLVIGAGAAGMTAGAYAARASARVLPAITFTYGGLRADASCRALRRDGPIPGLLVAGVDMGGVYHRGYAGGLARAVVFGIRAAQTATSG